MRQLIFYLGRAVCHQLADRSLAVGDYLPVCARCAGIFTGVLISHLWVAFSPKKRRTLPLLSVSILLALLMLPLVWDGLTSYLGLRETTNLLRLVTGMLMGCVLPLFYLPLVNDDPRPVPGQSLNWLDLTGLLVVGLVVGGGVYFAAPASWWLWALVIAAGHFLLYFGILRLIFARLDRDWLWALTAYGLFILVMNLARNFAGV